MRNLASQDIRAAQRRAIIARIVSQGNFNQQEILRRLTEEERFVNPDTGEAYNVATIQRDMVQLRHEWAQKAFRDTSEMIAEQDHKLDEIERVAWEIGNLEILVKTWDRRQKLHGLDAREVVQMAALKSKLVQLLIDGEIDEQTLIREIGSVNAGEIIDSARIAVFETTKLCESGQEIIDGEFNTIPEIPSEIL